MWKKTWSVSTVKGSLIGQRFRKNLSVLLSSVPIMTGFTVLFPAHAVNNVQTDDVNGVMQVHGVLSESACRLDMASAWQDINLGYIATGRLRHAGDRGSPVQVQLKLEDCIAGPARSLDERSGNLRWSPGQPAATISFFAPADADNPQLIQVWGASGIALRITDKLGRDIRLGSKGANLLLTPGNNQLVYTLIPVRTTAPLKAGAFQAKINVGLSYD